MSRRMTTNVRRFGERRPLRVQDLGQVCAVQWESPRI
jgi:hypothetical protein